MYKIRFLDGTVIKFESLQGANLKGADLEEANLEGADLERANLRGANLNGADLRHTGIISGTLGRDFYFYHEGYLKVGCVGNTLSWWLENYKEKGKENEYSKREIHDYGSLIKFLIDREKTL